MRFMIHGKRNFQVALKIFTDQKRGLPFFELFDLEIDLFLKGIHFLKTL